MVGCTLWTSAFFFTDFLPFLIMIIDHSHIFHLVFTKCFKNTWGLLPEREGRGIKGGGNFKQPPKPSKMVRSVTAGPQWWHTAMLAKFEHCSSGHHWVMPKTTHPEGLSQCFPGLSGMEALLECRRKAALRCVVGLLLFFKLRSKRNVPKPLFSNPLKWVCISQDPLATSTPHALPHTQAL